MDFFRTHPFIRLLIPFLIGILIQFYFPQPNMSTMLVLVLFTAAFLVVSRIWLPYKIHYLKGIILFIGFITAGIFATQQHQTTSDSVSLGENQTWFLGTLKHIPLEKEKVFSAEIDVSAIKIGQEWKEESLTMLLYFEKDSLVAQLRAGQLIVFRTQINEKVQASNPFGFDYARYLELKQIDFSIFLRQNDWHLISQDVSGIRQSALNLRAKIISMYEKAGINGDELAVLSALTLGYKNKMDAKVRNAYAGAGASHILAVSGMHVVILYSVFMFLLSWMLFFSKKPKLKFLLILLMLWVYALVTGLSPSVSRACTMFSFILVGLILNKRVNIYNSLAASAFVLLFFNPLLLFDLGFQLSYIAVAGIVFFQPKIYRLIYIKNKWLDALWQLTAVSIAAQLVTSPITLYYFHQFPVYFWLSNFIVIVGATLLLYGAMLFLVLSKIPLLAQLIGSFLKYVVMGMNGFVTFVNTLPKAVITDIPVDLWMLWFLVFLLVFLSAWLITKRYRYLLISLSLIFLGTIRSGLLQLRVHKQVHVCVYEVSGESAIQFISGDKSWWFVSDSLANIKIERIVSGANLFWRTTHNQYVQMHSFDSIIIDDAFMYFKGFWQLGNTKGLLVTNQTQTSFSIGDTLNFDMLVVTGKKSLPGNLLPPFFKFNQIIVDGSLPTWKRNDWKKNTQVQQTHFTSNFGAFISQ